MSCSNVAILGRPLSWAAVWSLRQSHWYGLEGRKRSLSIRSWTMEEQRAIGILRNDPQMRAAFINQIAPPIANKMFDCGMIP
jgi:hypothetical protein